jgi:hypothetical protein
MNHELKVSSLISETNGKANIRSIPIPFKILGKTHAHKYLNKLNKYSNKISTCTLPTPIIFNSIKREEKITRNELSKSDISEYHYQLPKEKNKVEVSKFFKSNCSLNLKCTYHSVCRSQRSCRVGLRQKSGNA